MHVCSLFLSQLVLYSSHFWTWMKYPMQCMGSSFLSSYRGPGQGSLGVQRSLFPEINFHQLRTGEEIGENQADKPPFLPLYQGPLQMYFLLKTLSEKSCWQVSIACWMACYGSFQLVMKQELVQSIKSIYLHLSLLLFLLPLPLQTWTSISQRKH